MLGLVEPSLPLAVINLLLLPFQFDCLVDQRLARFKVTGSQLEREIIIQTIKEPLLPTLIIGHIIRRVASKLVEDIQVFCHGARALT
jgi:hypothetical protein